MWWKGNPSRKELLAQLTQLTEQMSEVTEKLQKQSVNVTVQSLHVDKATLERLVFRLDSLDIHDLSGSLNLGNNFQQPSLQSNQAQHQVHLGNPIANDTGRFTKTVSHAASPQGLGTERRGIPLKGSAASPPDETKPEESHDADMSAPDGHLQTTSQGFAIRFP